MKVHEPSKWFIRFLDWNLRRKWVSLSLGLLLLIGSIAAYVTMPKGALDASDASYVSVQMNYPKDVPVKDILEKGKQLEQDLMKQPQAETVIMQSGNSADAAKWGNVTSETLVDYTVVMKKVQMLRLLLIMFVR